MVYMHSTIFNLQFEISFVLNASLHDVYMNEYVNEMYKMVCKFAFF